jgi:hypothetical protein
LPPIIHHAVSNADLTELRLGSSRANQYNVIMTQTRLAARTNRFVRIAGRDAPAAQVLAAAQTAWPHIQVLARPTADTAHDYTQIDLELTLPPAATAPPTPPVAGVGYAGLTPQQRARFWQWLDDPTTPAPAVFQQLYLAHLEVTLLEGLALAKLVPQELGRLHAAPAWAGHEGLGRVTLLSAWLAQDGELLARWINTAGLPVALLGLAVGYQAQLGGALTPEVAAHLLGAWQMTERPARPALLALRLRSLATNLSAEPLAYALAQLGPSATTPRPWRTNHRDLRLALPQPDLRPVLEPLLTEIIAVGETAEPTPALAETAETGEATLDEQGWRLVLEFGQSRSDLFDFALTIAQRLPAFAQLLDENRKLVYRVIFKKGDMRNFWRLWSYVQSWSTTRIYLNGRELEKWQVFPYSQYLK